MKKELIALFAILFLPSLCFAYSPPINSPMARGEHPRIFFNSSDLPVMRDRISAYYRNDFQNFIYLLDDTSQLSNNQKLIENDWGSLNYAFMAVLGPTEMKARGFIFSASLDSPQEYCARAMSYASKKLANISSSMNLEHGALNAGYPKALYFPVVAAYDWCYPYLSVENRTAIVDAFVSAYNLAWKGRNLMNSYGNEGWLTYNQESNNQHDLLGILAFYNDPYPSTAIQTELYDAFYTVWVNRTLRELNYLFKNASSSPEASGGYMFEVYMDMIVPFAMMSSSMNDYLSATPYFSMFPIFIESNLKPSTLLSHCGTGSQRCPEYMERWGAITSGISGISCKNTLLTSGFLRKLNNPYSPLAKWNYNYNDQSSCSSTVTEYGGIWSNAVLFWFISGDREVTARSPTDMNIAKTQKIGLGDYIMKSSYTPDATQIVFFSQENTVNSGGHAAKDWGTFTLHKFGNLILHAGNSKSGDALITVTDPNVFKNVVGIHKGASDSTLDFNRGFEDSVWVALGYHQFENHGKVLGEDINNGLYDYVFYDNSLSWLTSTANLSQRELIYIRGTTNNEYLVVLDRMNVNNSVDEKIWKIWVPVQPVFENGNPTNPRDGKWISSNTNVISMKNNFSGLKTSNAEFAPTHGKFYMKTLSPDNFMINVLGGPGKEFQSGNDDGTTPWNAPVMTQGMHEYLGWGRIEIRPSVLQNYDTFFNILQFGDSNTLVSMSEVLKLVSGDGKMIGSFINDASNRWVVMFAKNPERISSTAYTISGSGSVKHFIADLLPNSNYDVNDGGVASVKRTNSAGVLYFNSTLSGSKTITLSQGTLLSCVQMGGVLISSCSAEQNCSGSIAAASDGSCCLGVCQNNVGGLKGEWLFDEDFTISGIARDTSGNGNDGIVNGTSWISGGRIGGAASFDGTNDLIDLGKKLKNSNSMSISTWVYYRGAGNRINSYWPSETIFSDMDQTGGNDLVFATNGTAVGIRADKSGNILNHWTKDQINLGVDIKGGWHHFAWTMNYSTSIVYFDGNLLKTIYENASNIGYHGAAIGCWYNNVTNAKRDFFNGSVDDFRYYDKVLNFSEITYLYNAGVPKVVCGNGLIENGEVCDDSNIISNDGCSTSCQVESGWLCSGQPSVCKKSVQGLVASWLFNEDFTASGIVRDNSGNGFDGTVGGARWINSGKYGGAAKFDGIDDNISLLRLKSPINKTIAVWINFTGAPPKNYSTIFECGNDNPWFGVNSNNQVELYKSVVSTTVISLNRWYFVVFTSNGSRSAIYIDGVLEKTGSANTQVGSPCGIGRNFGDMSFNGTIDDLRIYNKSLSTSEIIDLYNNFVSAGGGSTPLIGPLGKKFIRGDFNGNGRVDVTDAINLIDYIFNSGKNPVCMKAADANDDGKIGVSDATKIINVIFNDEIMPPPYPEEGYDFTDDDLSC